MPIGAIYFASIERKDTQEIIFLVNSYLDKKKATCREERQFALLLNNSVKREDAKIMKRLDIKGEIVDVFLSLL